MKITFERHDGGKWLFDDSENVADAICSSCFPYSPKAKMIAAIKATIKMFKVHNASSVSFCGGTLFCGDKLNEK